MAPATAANIEGRHVKVLGPALSRVHEGDEGLRPDGVQREQRRVRHADVLSRVHEAARRLLSSAHTRSVAGTADSLVSSISCFSFITAILASDSNLVTAA